MAGKAMKIPNNIIEQITIYCEENDFGMAEAYDKSYEVGVIIIANNEFSPDQANILIAHLLLTAVIIGSANQANKEKREDDTRGTKVN